MASQLIVGAHVVCYLNGSAYSKVAGMSYQISTPNREIMCVDSVVPAELAPTRVSVSATLQLYRLRGDGGIEAAGMAATWRNHTQAKYFNLMVVDRLSDTVIFQIDQATVESQSWNIGRGFVMGTVTIKGIGWENETQPDPAL